MKKILTPIVILLLAFLVACGGESPVDTGAVATEVSQVVDDAVDTVTNEEEEPAVEEEPVASATGCYWQDGGSGEWVPVSEIGLENTTFEQCYALDSCAGGLGESGGGCYKWADGPDGDAYPWDDSSDANLPADRWAGTVLGGGSTTISINGVETQSDANGNFELAVPTAADSRYVINADQDGALPISQIHIGSAMEDLVLEFQPAETFAIDPTQPITVEDSRGTQIEIEAGQLVDANGNPATGELTLETYTYDLTEEPMVGDMSALNTDGELVAMESAGAFSAEFTDDAGGEYNLAEGAVAEISIPAEVAPRPDEVLTVWSYNTETGLWEEEGPATLVDGRYVAEVSHFSTWNFDWEMRSPACVKLEVSADLLAETSPMQVKAVLQTNPVSVRTLQVSDEVNVLTNLPTDTDVQFFMPADAATPFRTVNTGSAWGSTGTPAFPYDVCNGVAEIVPEPPAPTTGTLTGRVVDATNGNAISGAQVCVQDTCVTADSDGNYTIADLPAGDYVLMVTADGYISLNDEAVTVTAGETTTKRVPLSSELAVGELRIVLEWGTAPRDLDSHLWLPDDTNIFYNNRTATNVNLDIDDQDGEGPETITISQLEDGTYTYAVNNYSGNGEATMSTSSAVVRVYRGDQEINMFPVPTTGEGVWWTVFTMDGATGTITPVNTLSDTAPR